MRDKWGTKWGVKSGAKIKVGGEKLATSGAKRKEGARKVRQKDKWSEKSWVNRKVGREEWGKEKSGGEK